MVRLRWMVLLMVLVMLIITGFQAYWLRGNYRREKNVLETRVNFLLREAVRDVQDSINLSQIQRVLKDTVAAAVNIKRAMPRTAYNEKASNVVRLLAQSSIADSIRRKQARIANMKITLQSSTGRVVPDSGHAFKFNLDSIDPSRIREMVVIKPPVRENIGRDSAAWMQAPQSISIGRLSPKKVSVRKPGSNDSARRSGVVEVNTIYITNDRGDQVLLRLDSLLTDSLPLPILTQKLSQSMQQEKLNVSFTIHKAVPNVSAQMDSVTFRPSFLNHQRYQAEMDSPAPFLLKKIRLPILFSVFLVGITLLSFVFLYRNLLRQQRLSQMKSDLMSNITHELKTPIATVGVAIEALKNFNAIQDPLRTREYLDISQNELQRLSLLVDKVLKLSMFEKKDVELKQEVFDLGQVVDEVVSSLRLQTEKYRGQITVETSGSLQLRGDRLHLQSVVFNLLDNALKYSKENPSIRVQLTGREGEVELKVSDNGIGIPAGYLNKVFEKFFRVPTGDTHNAKGHGLGLSYVAQVVKQHGGTISLDSHEGIGSTFTIIIPKNQRSV